MNPFINHPILMEMHAYERVKDLRREAEMWRLAEQALAARRREQTGEGLVARAAQLLASIRRRVRPQAQGPAAC